MPDRALKESYDAYERVERQFQETLDRSLEPRGPEMLFDLVGGTLPAFVVRLRVPDCPVLGPVEKRALRVRRRPDLRVRQRLGRCSR